MKKQYSKPGIIIEDFAIAQNIAAGCGAITNPNKWGWPGHANRGVCGWHDGLDIIWAAKPMCTEDGITKIDAIVGGLCYHNPSDEMNIFSS